MSRRVAVLQVHLLGLFLSLSPVNNKEKEEKKEGMTVRNGRVFVREHTTYLYWQLTGLSEMS